MIDLILCAVCKRHIRPEEVCCPFCDTAVPAPERRPKFAPIPVGLSRSRLYALHAAAFATGVAAAACGGKETIGTADAAASLDAPSIDAPVADGSVVDAIALAVPDAAGLVDATVIQFADAAAFPDVTAEDAASDAPPPPPPPPPYGCMFPGGCDDVIA